MARKIGWESVPFILNQISWNLKTISDSLQTIAETEDTPEVIEFKQKRSLEKLKYLNSTKHDPITTSIEEAIRNAHNK